MSSKTSASKKEADFRVQASLPLTLSDGRPIEELLGHREFQSRGRRICAVIMRRYEGIMRAYYGRSYDVDDLFGDACLNVVKFMSTLRPNNVEDERAFFSWFFVLALNIVRSKVRKFEKAREEGATLIHVPVDELQLADKRVQPEQESLRNQFLEFTATLQPHRRQAAVLWYEGNSAREIKAILNDRGIKCSHVSIQNWINECLADFGSSMRGDGGGCRGV